MEMRYFCSVEYDTLSRLGIDNPKGYITRRYGSRDDVIQLESCCVGQMIVMEVEAALEEVQTSGGWVDIMVRHGRQLGLY